jgi:hypothetical protein
MSELAEAEHLQAFATPTPEASRETAVAERDSAARPPLSGLSRPVDSSDPMGGAATPASVTSVLNGAGTPLPGSLRRTMEESLGADFSSVRLHTGAAAERSADDVAARAYTAGDNVVLGRGTNLDSDAGMHTLAHELTHVVQQRTGRDRSSSGTVGLANDPLEHEAEASAHSVMGALRRQAKNCGCGQEH